MRTLECPECHRVASVADHCKRPICVHNGASNGPEIWDGDDVDGEGRRIEDSPEPRWRTPGPTTWAEMVPVSSSDGVRLGDWLTLGVATGFIFGGLPFAAVALLFVYLLVLRPDA